MTHANPGQESAIHDFARSVLEVMRFDERETILRTWYDISLPICGDIGRSAKKDVCLRNTMILLVLQEDKTVFSP